MCEKVGEKIKELRVEKKMSQEDLSRASGVSRQTILTLETGKACSANTGTLAALAKALDVSISVFFE